MDRLYHTLLLFNCYLLSLNNIVATAVYEEGDIADCYIEMQQNIKILKKMKEDARKGLSSLEKKIDLYDNLPNRYNRMVNSYSRICSYWYRRENPNRQLPSCISKLISTYYSLTLHATIKRAHHILDKNLQTVLTRINLFERKEAVMVKLVIYKYGRCAYQKIKSGPNFTTNFHMQIKLDSAVSNFLGLKRSFGSHYVIFTMKLRYQELFSDLAKKKNTYDKNHTLQSPIKTCKKFGIAPSIARRS